MDECELEKLIDAGLATYAAQPPAGLATGVVARCRATPALIKGTAVSKWTHVASAVAAAGLVAAFLFLPRPQTQPRTLEVTRVPVQAQPVETRLSNEPLATVRGVPKRASRERIGRNGIVKNGIGEAAYMSSPSTEQEQMLAALASKHPRQLLEVMALNERQGDPLKVEPLSTKALMIEPLHIDPLNQRESE